jgi:hypothetical protein
MAPKNCQNLSPNLLTNGDVTIAYEVEKGRRFRLSDIRISGTNKLTLRMSNELKSQRRCDLFDSVSAMAAATRAHVAEADRRIVRAFMRTWGTEKLKLTCRAFRLMVKI